MLGRRGTIVIVTGIYQQTRSSSNSVGHLVGKNITAPYNLFSLNPTVIRSVIPSVYTERFFSSTYLWM